MLKRFPASGESLAEPSVACSLGRPGCLEQNGTRGGWEMDRARKECYFIA